MSAKNQSHLPNIVRHGLMMWLDTQYDSSIQPYSQTEGITWVDLSGDYETEETNPSRGELRTGVKCDVSYPNYTVAAGPGFTGGQEGGQIDGRALGVRFNGKAGSHLTLPKNAVGYDGSNQNPKPGSTPFFYFGTNDGLQFPTAEGWTIELWFNADSIGHNQGLICGCPYFPPDGEPATPFVNVDPRRIQPLHQEDSFFSIRYNNRPLNPNADNVIRIGFGNGEALGDIDTTSGKGIKWYETKSNSQTFKQWTHLVVSHDPDLVQCSGATTRDAGIRVWINGLLDTPSFVKNFECTESILFRQFEAMGQFRIGMAEIEPVGAGSDPEPIGEVTNRNWVGEIGCVRAYNFPFKQAEVDQNFRETSYRFGQRTFIGIA